ncbi:glycosyl transferase family protein [Candidatus Magnetomorum sp. HK-1]|nr:glycosyl transferase family protein [Candidatus Magnetomorum sp. HK-1]
MALYTKIIRKTFRGEPCISPPFKLLILFGSLFFINLGGPYVIDNDEALYAEISREMYQVSDWITPKFNREDCFLKPPMLYWTQILGYKMFGVTALGARFINAISGIATIMILYFGARIPLGCRPAFNTSLILGSSFIFVYLSRIAHTDMLLTMFFTLCLVTSWYGVERVLKGRNGTVLFWIGCLAAGFAMLSKGAIGVLFPALTSVIYLISIKRPGILFQKTWLVPGTIIMLTVGFSWYLILGFSHPDGFDFIEELFMNQHLSRFLNAMEGHSGPIYYYLIILLVGFMPWFSYLPIVFVQSSLENIQKPAGRFLWLFCIFSIVVLIFFSIAKTKLPNYILPALPGFALIIAALFEEKEMKRLLPWHFAGWISAGLVIIPGILFAAAPFIFPYLPELIGDSTRKIPALAENVPLGFTPLFVGGLFVGCGITIVRATKKNNVYKIFKSLLITSFIISASFFLAIIPIYDRLMNQPLVRLSKQAATHIPPNGWIVLYQLNYRPSVIFASNRRTVFHSEKNYQELPLLFDPSDIAVGITTAYYFDRLNSYGISTLEISRDTGFILFRLTNNQIVIEYQADKYSNENSQKRSGNHIH